MKRLLPLALLALAACQNGADDGNASNAAEANSSAANDPAAGSTVWLNARDRTVIKGTFYKAAHPKAIILLFHQADSSKEEYATIAPRLVQAGYSALAIDQRSGGEMYGHNETVARLGKSADMADTLPDLQAAVTWAKPFHTPIILWGSSYSASLVLGLANINEGDIKALLAFSPGEYFADKRMVGRDAEGVRVPAFITCSGAPDEVAKAKAVAARIPGGRATLYIPDHGAHGSSTLIAAKDPDGAAANWDAVLAFLAKVTG